MRPFFVFVMLLLAGCAGPSVEAPEQATDVAPTGGSQVRVLQVAADPKPIADLTSADLIRDAQAAGKLDETAALVYRGLALVGDDRLPAEYRGDVAAEDAGFFREALTLVTSSPEAREKLIPFLVRPTDARSIFSEDRTLATMSSHAADSAPYDSMCPRQWANRSTSVGVLVWALCPSPHYWTPEGLNLVDAELDAAVAMVDDIFPRMSGLMGDPIPDDRALDPNGWYDQVSGGAAIDPDGRIDIYLVGEASQGVVRGPKDADGSRYWTMRGREGVTVPTFPFDGRTSSGFVLMDRNFLDTEPERFKSALAHELFHVFQNSFNEKYSFRGAAGGGLDEHWFVEATAVWAQAHFVKETSGLYVHQRFADHQRAGRGLQDLDYEAYIWPFFMEQRASPEAIRAAWDGIGLADTWEDADAAIDDAFSFEKEFRIFAARNLNERYEGAIDPLYAKHDAQFPVDAATKPPIARLALESQVRSSLHVEIDPLRARYLRIDGDGAASHLVVDARGVGGAGPLQLDALVLRQGKWTLERLAASREAEICGADEVILILSNAGFAADAALAGDMILLQAPGGCDCKSFGEVERWILDVDIEYDEALPEVSNGAGGSYQGTYAHRAKQHLETFKGSHWSNEGNLTSSFSYSSVVALTNSDDEVTYQRTQGEGTPASSSLSFVPDYGKCTLRIHSTGMIPGSEIHGQPVNAVLNMLIAGIPIPANASQGGIHGTFALPAGRYCLDFSQSCDAVSSQPLFHWYQDWKGSLGQGRATVSLMPAPPEGTVPVQATP